MEKGQAGNGAALTESSEFKPRCQLDTAMTNSQGLDWDLTHVGVSQVSSTADGVRAVHMGPELVCRCLPVFSLDLHNLGQQPGGKFTAAGSCGRDLLGGQDDTGSLPLQEPSPGLSYKPHSNK